MIQKYAGFRVAVMGLICLASLWTPAQDLEGPGAVSALGYVEPEGGVIRLSGNAGGDGNVVRELRVREGEAVAAEQVIAVLANHDRLAAAFKRSEATVAVKRARLEQAKAGVSEGAISEQKARIDRLAVQIESAAAECRRAETLWRDGTLSEEVYDQRCLEEKVLRGQKLEAEARLRDITEIREIDVAVFRAELNDAVAALEQARVDVERAMVRAPKDGRILKIYTRPGEQIHSKGIADLGQTGRMWIHTEVYETDISRVKVGQKATITGSGFSGTLNGTVEEIGLMIGRNQIIGTDPTADVDARVVEVKIRLDDQDGAAVERLTNLQVNVVIKTGSGS